MAKDEIISVQERKIVSLIEANSTLRSGLHDLITLPKTEESDSDESEKQQSLKKRGGEGRGGGKGRGRGGYSHHLPPMQQSSMLTSFYPCFTWLEVVCGLVE